ncbi:MAG: EscU/YscU/HrcU family type III secretion system export apparatus switch protein [Sulfurimonadaceae bacterium]|nr:EscU/YscU/HrcU family type III secretion system export apparatus switch protein [Sulfurimonadaceae bacterium]
MKKAVALKYDREKDPAPKVTAKGKGKVAEKIIEVAELHELPIKKDEDLVEMLAQVELDRQIPENLYKAVAEVFIFVYNVTREKETDAL